MGGSENDTLARRGATEDLRLLFLIVLAVPECVCVLFFSILDRLFLLISPEG